MIIPIRCYTCGKPIAHLWEDYRKRTEGGEEPKKVLDDLGLERYCCRRMLLSHINLIDEVIKFGPQGYKDEKVQEGP
ncbi:DNA-directed RNA polymerase subunit N [Candidatus Undinarchaeota archaeon]